MIIVSDVVVGAAGTALLLWLLPAMVFAVALIRCDRRDIPKIVDLVPRHLGLAGWLVLARRRR